MVAHQIAQDAAEGRQLTKRLERPIRIGSEQSLQDRFAAFHAIFSAQISDRVAGNQALLH